MSADPQRIGARLRSERLKRHMTVDALAEALRETASERDRRRMPKLQDLRRTIRGHEAGEHPPGPRYRMLYAAAFDMEEDELFADRPAEPPPVSTPAEHELLDLSARAGATDVAAGTFDLLDTVVDQACRDYPTVAPDVLSQRGKAHLDYVLRLLDGRTTLAEHRELLVRAGWLSVLLACTLFDAGDKLGAEIARRTAQRLGEQAGHGEIIAWSWEVAAWFALVDHRFDDVVAYSEAGLRHAGVTNAAVQLTLQAGRGYARMRDRRAHDALKAGRKILEQLPRPDHPDHHFVFDHDKYEFYCSTIYTMLGQDDAAEEHAREVISQCRLPDDSVRWPMRYAMVQLDLGLVSDRRGDLDGAIRHGRAALVPERRSGDLLPRATELCARLYERYPGERRVAEFAEQLRDERAIPGPKDGNAPS